MYWATFWAIFSLTHLVALFVCAATLVRSFLFKLQIWTAADIQQVFQFQGFKTFRSANLILSRASKALSIEIGELYKK
jgi:hypothetical protein